MLKKLLPTNGYRRKLARVIVLADGTELVTLRDAANVLLDVFGSVNAQSGEPDNATRLLLIAAKDGQASRHCGRNGCGRTRARCRRPHSLNLRPGISGRETEMPET